MSASRYYDFCYHTHTKRCGHAYGEDEEYVIAAIKKGIKRLGFSDHCIFPGMKEPGQRGSFDMLPGYIDSVLTLKEKYKDQIEIFLGFEAEYHGGKDVRYLFDLLKGPFDYFIQGQHSGRKGDKSDYYGSYDTHTANSRYVEDVIAGMNSGLYAYLAHPDLYLQWNKEWNQETIDMAYTILKEAKRLNMPVELNCGFLRRDKVHPPVDDLQWMHYPYPKFWEIVKEVGNTVTFGIDAHSPSDFDHESADQVLSIADRCGLTVVEPDILLPKKVLGYLK